MHMNEQNSPLTVEKFCLMSEEQWDALAKEHALTALRPHCAHVAHHYRFFEHRDPTFFELHFLGTLADTLSHDPRTVHVASLSGDAAQLRVFSDVCRMRQTLMAADAPTLAELMQASSAYLVRAGITPHHADLVALPHAHAALHPAFGADALTIAHASATRTTNSATCIPNVGVLLAYTPTDGADIPASYAAFVAEHRALGVAPIAPVGEEGILPHLLRTNGVILDLPSKTEHSACLFPHTLLLTAPEGALPTLFAKALPITLLGKLTPSGMLRMLCGGTLQLSLPLSLLRTLRAEHYLALHTVTDEGTYEAPVLQETPATLLGGVSATGDVANATLALVSELARAGGDFTHCTASPLLLCPAYATDDVIARTIPLLLGWHRAAAELSLPSLSATVFPCDMQAPTFSLFLAVKKGTERKIETPKDWQSARNALYGT